MTIRSAAARGFSLVEMMIVMIIAGLVSFGLVGFYLNSQATWLDASAQALAQRDATSIVERIASRAGEAATVAIWPSPPDTILSFYRTGQVTPFHRFWWSHTDSLFHEGDGPIGDDGPLVSSRIESFSVQIDPSLPLVHIQKLQVRSATGRRTTISTSIPLYNAP